MKTLKSNFKLSFKVSKFYPKKLNLQQLILLVFLLVLIVVGILPGYWQGGQWSWSDLAKVENQKALNQIKKDGLEIPGWKIEDQGEVQLGDKKWSLQKMVQNEQKFTLLLAPQTYYLDSPSVEWTDIKHTNVDAIYCNSRLYDLMDANPEILGIKSEFSKIKEIIKNQQLSMTTAENLLAQLPRHCQGKFTVQERNQKVEIFGNQSIKDWQTDSYQKLTISLESGKKLETLFFRGRNKQETFAVIQWYNWNSGGSFAPRKWFFADLWAQLQKRRAPWVAVSVRIPIKVLGKIETVKPLAESIVKEVQTAITEKIIGK